MKYHQPRQGRPKFKVGDRVKAKKAPAWIEALPNNQTYGTIAALIRGKANIHYTVCLDNGSIIHRQAFQLIRLI